MEIAEPTIEQAISACAENGASKVVIAPYFLSRGRHIQEDIPALVRAAQAKYSQLVCVMAEPIGVDALMAQLIEQRVKAAQQQAGTASTFIE
jgi:sirohydrochlorin ferrochelatase